MQQAWRMEIDLFAQDNMRLQELVDTALAAPFIREARRKRPSTHYQAGGAPTTTQLYEWIVAAGGQH
jgi:hypothetical protein